MLRVTPEKPQEVVSAYLSTPLRPQGLFISSFALITAHIDLQYPVLINTWLQSQSLLAKSLFVVELYQNWLNVEYKRYLI